MCGCAGPRGGAASFSRRAPRGRGRCFGGGGARRRRVRPRRGAAGPCARAAAPVSPAACAVFRAAGPEREQGRPVDALALRGDEGRGTLRKAAGRCERSLIRGCPNGATPPFWETPRRIHGRGGRTRGTETSQYPEEKTSTEIPRVVASESGAGQWPLREKPKDLERSAAAGDSPVGVVLRAVLE